MEPVPPMLSRLLRFLRPPLIVFVSSACTMIAHALDPVTVDAILAEGRAVLLTDRYAPVDQMLAPAVRGEEARPFGDEQAGGTASP